MDILFGKLLNGLWGFLSPQRRKLRSSQQLSGQERPSLGSMLIAAPTSKSSAKAGGNKLDGQSTTRKVDKIIIHCSDTYEHMNIGAKEIKEWHTKDRGWSDIGYHFVIPRDATIEPGRDLDSDGDIFEEIGAHTYGYNRNSIGICLVGGRGKDDKPEDNFTPQQMSTLAGLIRVIRADYPKAAVHGHNEFANKACPSFNVRDWYKKAGLT